MHAGDDRSRNCRAMPASQPGPGGCSCPDGQPNPGLMCQMMAFRGTPRNTIYAATVAAVMIIIMGAAVDVTGSRGCTGREKREKVRTAVTRNANRWPLRPRPLLPRMRTHHADVHTHTHTCTCTCTPLYTRIRRRAHAPLVARRFIRVLILSRATTPAPPLAFPPSSITGTAAVVDNRRVRHHLHTTCE